jgi:hypothetical protein
MRAIGRESPDTSHPVLAGLFVIVPSGLLLGASRVRWIAHHAWTLVLAGPIVFTGCYAGICEPVRSRTAR